MSVPVDEHFNLAEKSGRQLSELPKARLPLAKQEVLFDERFLDRHAGAIITDPSIAIVELVANAWDAYATEVKIVWPARSKGTKFSITDNGKGMTSAEFEKRWKTLDYNRLREEGAKTAPPPELKGFPPRVTYGRNGKGRHAAFRFSDPYQVRTWRDGTELTFEVRRGVARPFERKPIGTRKDLPGHGTEISATSAEMTVGLGVEEAREIIGTRFLADPNFNVFIDGTLITFDDVPRGSLQETKVEVPGFGVADLYMIDTQKTDRTTHQHGIAERSEIASRDRCHALGEPILSSGCCLGGPRTFDRTGFVTLAGARSSQLMTKRDEGV